MNKILLLLLLMVLVVSIVLISSCSDQMVLEHIRNQPIEDDGIERVTTWFGITDEVEEDLGDFQEDCSMEIPEAEEKYLGSKCKLINQQCFEEDECVEKGADDISMVGCCRCTFDCYSQEMYNEFEIIEG